MKLVNTALAAGLLSVVSLSGAEAITFEFSCTGDQSNSQCTQSGSGGSTTSAILEFTQAAGDTIEVIVDNTSPIDYAPALLSFGFFVDPDGTNLLSFDVVAFDDQSTEHDIEPFWDVVQNEAGLNADFIADNGNGVQDGLYNPGIIGTPSASGTAPNPFFTTAIFTFVFDREISLLVDDTDVIGSGLTGAAFVRFKNVGPYGDGSSKIACQSGDPACGNDPTPVPEPGMLAMAGVGLVGVSFMLRRRRRGV